MLLVPQELERLESVGLPYLSLLIMKSSVIVRAFHVANGNTAPVLPFSVAEGLGPLAARLLPLAAERGYSAEVAHALFEAWCAIFPAYKDAVKDKGALVPYLESIAQHVHDPKVVEVVYEQFDRLAAAYETVLERGNKYKTIPKEIFDVVITLPYADGLDETSTTTEIMERLLAFANSLFEVVAKMRAALVAASPKKGKNDAVSLDDSEFTDVMKTAYKSLSTPLVSRVVAALTYFLLVRTKCKAATIQSMVNDLQLNFAHECTLVPCTMAQARNTMNAVFGDYPESDILFEFIKTKRQNLSPALAQEVMAAAQSPIRALVGPILRVVDACFAAPHFPRPLTSITECPFTAPECAVLAKVLATKPVTAIDLLAAYHAEARKEKLPLRGFLSTHLAIVLYKKKNRKEDAERLTATEWKAFADFRKTHENVVVALAMAGNRQVRKPANRFTSEKELSDVQTQCAQIFRDPMLAVSPITKVIAHAKKKSKNLEGTPEPMSESGSDNDDDEEDDDEEEDPSEPEPEPEPTKKRKRSAPKPKAKPVAAAAMHLGFTSSDDE